jgi:putative Mn2+ efflux pump MntP
MQMWFDLILQSIALGVALAMDAFSVSMANGLNDPGMSKKRMCIIAGTFAGFQFAMPMIGWFCVTRIKEIFQVFEQFIPWIALILLVLIGGKMLVDGIKDPGEETEEEAGTQLTGRLLFVQGVATSIDALSTGFTTSSYHVFQAFVSSLIIAVVTFFICIFGVKLGKKFGLKLAGRAQILGGVILILIGLKICFIG